MNPFNFISKLFKKEVIENIVPSVIHDDAWLLKQHRIWKRSVENGWIDMGGSVESYEKFRRLPMVTKEDFEAAFEAFKVEFSNQIHYGE